MDLGSALVLAGAAVVLAVALEGIRHLGRLRRKGVEEPVMLQGTGFRLELPSWWQAEGSGTTFIVDTRDHDGRLRLEAGPVDALSPDQALARLLQEPGLDVDDAEIVSFAAGPCAGAHAQSRVSVEEDDRTDRSYRAWWVLDGPDLRITAVYDCSVLYGLVDGVYLEAAMRSVRFGDRSAAQDFEQAPPVPGDQA